MKRMMFAWVLGLVVTLYVPFDKGTWLWHLPTIPLSSVAPKTAVVKTGAVLTYKSIEPERVK